MTVVPTPTPAFAAVIAQLDTPTKVGSYLRNEFHYVYHDNCVSYWPEEFYNLKGGDCKDYATFASYALAQHGYYAEIVSFKFYNSDEELGGGHSVVIYRDVDGVLKYMSNGRVLDAVTSMSDLLEKERRRLHASRIGGYIVMPAGNVVNCSPNVDIYIP